MKVNRGLSLINLSCCQIGDRGIQALSDTLKENKGLETLILTHNLFGDAGAIALGEALMLNTSLKSFRITNNEIISNGVATALKAASNIRRVSLMPWSLLIHSSSSRFNLHISPVVKTVFLIELRSRQKGFHLPYLPPEMWLEILKHLRYRDFGPLVLPAP